MAGETDKPYAYYATKANSKPPAVATEIAREFHPLWWSAPNFAQSREEFGETLSTEEGPLKVEVAKYTRAALAGLPTDGSLFKELQTLKSAVIDGVITTNYDGLMEWCFPEFHSFVGQDALLFAASQGIGEIYKVHGCASDPESIVLTAGDYERFGERNPYLAAKLLTLFVEHPIIFMGYSLNDPDVTKILISVAKVLTTENLKKLQDQLIFVNWSRTPVEPSLSPAQIAAEGYSIPVAQLTISDFQGLFEILGELDRKFPAQLLRQLKEHVYDLVISNDPKSRLTLMDIDDDSNIDDLEVVFGVGLSGKFGDQGYTGLSRKQILNDALSQQSAWDPRRVVNETLPAYTTGRTYMPVYRYLQGAGMLTPEATLRDESSVSVGIAERVREGAARFKPSRSESGRASRIAGEVSDFRELCRDHKLHDVLTSAQCLDRNQIDLDEFRDYLIKNAAVLDGSASSTAWAKAVCLYDFLRFGS
jgi:hypothetical protein